MEVTLLFFVFFQGMPDWAEISKELPPMDDVLSKLER